MSDNGISLPKHVAQPAKMQKIQSFGVKRILKTGLWSLFCKINCFLILQVWFFDSPFDFSTTDPIYSDHRFWFFKKNYENEIKKLKF